jgi:hypothetical protein
MFERVTTENQRVSFRGLWNARDKSESRRSFARPEAFRRALLEISTRGREKAVATARLRPKWR